MNVPKFQTEDLEVMENLLIELLAAALKAPNHIRGPITDLAIGISNHLPIEAVERSKEYSLYRAKQGEQRGV
jgi:hypothetical protein